MKKQKTFNAKTQRRRDAKSYVVYVCVAVCLMLVGCIPAHEPDNLHNTPGAPVVVRDHLYQGTLFSAEIPDGWRVITGEAQAPQSVIFVAPDDKTLIRLIAGTVEEDTVTVENQRNEVIPVTLGNATTVTTVFSSPYSTWESYLSAFDRVRDSLSFR